MENIYAFLQSAKTNYESETIKLTDGLEFNQKNTLRLCDLYYNSTFESGKKDKRQKEKPFHNMVRYRVHLATRATDDGGEIKITPKRGRSDRRLHALLLNAQDAEWRDEAEFDAFRRKLRYLRAKYGGAVTKRHKDNGNLRISVVDWTNLITDQVDILSNPIIERHLMTPDKLMEMDWDNKDEAIKLAKANRAAEATDFTTRGNNTLGSFIEVYEISGVLPAIYLDENAGEYEYVRQKHIVMLDKTSTELSAKEAGGLTLYSGLQKDNPYDYIPWVEIQGRALGLGVIEMLFEAQVWMNYTKMAERDMLDIARNQWFHTTDPNFDVANLTTDALPGSVFKSAPNTQLTQINNTPTSLPAFETFANSWEQMADKDASSFEAITGEEQKSNSPYRQTLLLNNAAGSEFKYRRKEERDFIRRIYRRDVLPYHLTKVNTRTEMESVLSEDEMKFVDNAIVTVAERKAFIEGKIRSPQDLTGFRDTQRADLDAASTTRRIEEIPKGFLTKDHLTDLDVVVGTENDADGKLQLLERFFSVFGQALSNPQVMQNPLMMNVIQQASEAAGLSSKTDKPLTASPVAMESPATANAL